MLFVTCLALVYGLGAQSEHVSFVASWEWDEDSDLSTEEKALMHLHSSSYGTAVHNVEWDEKSETILVYGNSGFAKEESRGAIVEFSIDKKQTGVQLTLANVIELPCMGSRKWGGARVDYVNGSRMFWVSCGSCAPERGEVVAPAGLFSYRPWQTVVPELAEDGKPILTKENYPFGMLNAANASKQTYDPYSVWMSSAGDEWQFFVVSDDDDTTSEATVTACRTRNCKDTVVTVGTNIATGYMTSRIIGNELLVQRNVQNFINDGCCADTMFLYKISESAAGEPVISGEPDQIPLNHGRFIPGDLTANASHTFFPYREDNKSKVLLAVAGDEKQYVVYGEFEHDGNGGHFLRTGDYFEVPDTGHINGITRFQHQGKTYIATTDRDIGVFLFKENPRAPSLLEKAVKVGRQTFCALHDV